MIKRVIYLIAMSSFSERDVHRLGFEVLSAHGFDVEVWSCTPFLYPSVYEYSRKEELFRCRYLYRELHSRAEMRASIGGLDASCFVICLLGYSYTTFPVYRALSRRRVKYCCVANNVIPPLSMRSKARSVQISPARLLQGLFASIPPQYCGIRSPDVLLAGGARSIFYNYPVSRRTAVLWSHTFDYDLFLKDKRAFVAADKKIGVYLDEYLPFHPDFIHMMGAPTTPEDYYPLMCAFFDRLEEKYGVRIVVAAHPRSHYKEWDTCFGGRTIVKGKTLELVRQSVFAITHSSTSISFAVLFRKPVIFVTTDSVQKHPITGPWIDVMARWLNKKPINLNCSSSIDWENELMVDQEAYRSYQEAFVKKPGSPEKQSWEIFSDYLKALQS